MASGAMVHPCEFFLFCILQRMRLGNNADCPEKFFSPPKEQDPVLNLDSLIFYCPHIIIIGEVFILAKIIC